MEFESQPAQLLTGTCAGCGHSFTLLEGVIGAGRAAGRPATQPSEVDELPSGAASAASPPCSLCGAPLEISASGGGLSAVCSGCSSSFQFVLKTDSDRPFRRPPSRGGYGREVRDARTGPRARPCRNCGGPLQFSTSPQGLVTGTCAACGNRFTLPPRREEGARGPGDRPGRREGYAPRRGPGGWRRSGDRGAPPPRFRSRGPPFRRREDGRDSDEDESPRRHQRPRNDD